MPLPERRSLFSLLLARRKRSRRPGRFPRRSVRRPPFFCWRFFLNIPSSIVDRPFPSPY